MSENSIEFSLSNSEQRDSWLNSGHQTLDADTASTGLLVKTFFSLSNVSQMVTYLFVIGALES